MTIRERHMDTPLGRMAWFEAGAGWPVLLLHAFPLNAAMWRPQLERVPEGARFIAPDFPGFGRSELRRLPGNGLGLYAAAVGDLMDALELDDAVIAGLSMGGYVAFEMYRQLPGRFAGLVLADTRAQADTPEGRSGRARQRELLAREGAKGIADQMLPKLLSGGAAPDVVAAVRAMIEGADPLAIDAAIAALMDRPDSTGDLPNLSCATLVVVGEEDGITPVADAASMQRALPRATLTVIPGAGHLSNLEQPEIFSRALADFLLARL
jgi:pimeloyl-ACP methyl ester carboxylesterase